MLSPPSLPEASCLRSASRSAFCFGVSFPVTDPSAAATVSPCFPFGFFGFAFDGFPVTPSRAFVTVDDFFGAGFDDGRVGRCTGVASVDDFAVWPPRPCGPPAADVPDGPVIDPSAFVTVFDFFGAAFFRRTFRGLLDAALLDDAGGRISAISYPGLLRPGIAFVTNAGSGFAVDGRL